LETFLGAAAGAATATGATGAATAAAATGTDSFLVATFFTTGLAAELIVLLPVELFTIFKRTSLQNSKFGESNFISYPTISSNYDTSLLFFIEVYIFLP
jgi:hypothetical protein